MERKKIYKRKYKAVFNLLYCSAYVGDWLLRVGGFVGRLRQVVRGQIRSQRAN